MFLILALAGVASGQTQTDVGPKDCRLALGSTPIPPLPSGPPARDETRFAAIGDTGTGCDPSDPDRRLQCAVTNAMLDTQAYTRFDLLILLGDNVYESGSIGDFAEKLYSPFDAISRRNVLIKGVVGNHDVRSFDGANLQMKFFQAADSEAQRKYFTTPVSRHSSFPETASRYYTFTRPASDVEFFALDSSMIVNDCCGPAFWKRKFKKEERMAHIEWLVRTLSASRAKWKIVILHHPLYSSAQKHGVRVSGRGEELEESMKLLREPWPDEGPLKGRSIESLLKESGVKLVLAGHDHVYERIAPQGGVQYLVSGAGAKLRTEDFDHRLPAFHQCGESRKGSFLFLSAKPASIEFWSIAQDGVPFDYGIIR